MTIKQLREWAQAAVDLLNEVPDDFPMNKRQQKAALDAAISMIGFIASNSYGHPHTHIEAEVRAEVTRLAADSSEE